MSISSDTLRGYTDTIILTQLMAKDSYGYEINKSVQQRTGGKYEFKEATLYTAFKRLSQNGLITSYWGEEGTGARRRYYKITEEGKRQWEEHHRKWQETRGLLDALLTVEVDYESN
ncbi:helix-turn-helix transcriptional regulator [Roseburia hominis]